MAMHSFTRLRSPPRKFCRCHVLSLSIFLCIIISLSQQLCEGRLSGRDETENVEDIVYPRGDFLPLTCNERLDDDPCITPWSRVFGNQLVFPTAVEIPCGKCVVMYPLKDRQRLTFSGGLRVLGKLVIHSNDIFTTSILVHGELVIESLKPIDGVPDVSITWIDTKPNRTLFFQSPEGGDESNSICGGSRGACGMGRKPFVVAGGKLNIRGLPSPYMPTWVPLYDVDRRVSTSEDPLVSIPAIEDTTHKYKPPKPGCPKDDSLIHYDYLDSDLSDIFKGSYGSISTFTLNGGLKVTNRSHSQHCPVIDLNHIRRCLEPDKLYLMTMKVLLTRDGIVDETDCAKGKGDDHCMSIYQSRMSARGIGRTTSLWKERESFGSMLGEETTIAVDFNFTSKQLSESNIYEMIQLRGPGPGVDMELLEFTLRAPPKEAFPKNVCDDLVPTNGNAELLGLSPYPFRTNNDDTFLSVVAEGNNNYFEVTGRKFAAKKVKKGRSANAGITWDIPLSCMNAHANYTFHADVRMRSLDPASSEWKMKAYFPGKKRPIKIVVASCPKGMGTWVGCDGEFHVSEDLVEANRIEIFLETDASSCDVDYDVDNLSFKLVERSVDHLILPKSVENLWSVGAEIMITSHTSEWNGHSTRRISSIENHDEDGYVSVGLNEAIDGPLTVGSHPFYATEVALLSRNIVFSGEGGAHLTVLKTPGQDQIIQGVDFNGFGEEGVHRSYPIYFDSCNNNPNSIVSKNTIRESNQRCIVIDETNNMLIEGNIAFGNKGHCFVVQTGTEVGNVFKSNVGAFCQKSKLLLSARNNKKEETDDTPATFWIGSPSNHWIGNVASGSEGSGFWIQPKNDRQTGFAGSSHILSLTEFRDNVAHSTDEESLKITGYSPTQMASIKNFRSYLTNKGHFVVSRSSNIAAEKTMLDTPIESEYFPMIGTTIVPIEGGEEYLIEEDTEEGSFHHISSNPTDVFNLQSSPSLLE